jgi:hypothetical protein
MDNDKKPNKKLIEKTSTSLYNDYNNIQKFGPQFSIPMIKIGESYYDRQAIKVTYPANIPVPTSIDYCKYCSPITMDEAHRFLKAIGGYSKECPFVIAYNYCLVRTSRTPGLFTLSYILDGKVHHYRLEKIDGKFTTTLGGKSVSYDTEQEILDHFFKHMDNMIFVYLCHFMKFE